MQFPLRERKKMLQRSLKSTRGKIEVVEHKEMSKYDEIALEFQQSIDKNIEGIMLKDPSSAYVPKTRGNNWLKLKGEYVEGLTDSLDLVILGGYFGDMSYRIGGTNHWTDRITTFLLGLIQNIDPVN